jgi:signal peptidase I
MCVIDAYVELTGNEEALIKRIVASAGDVVEVKGNRLYVNGAMQEESYTNEFPDYSLAPM